MIADFFTKPLQGQAFYRLRDAIMNVLPSDPFHSSQRSVLWQDQETVGLDQKATGEKAKEDADWILVKRRGQRKATQTKQEEAHSKENT